MIIALIIFLFSFSFSKIIDHQVPQAIFYNSPLDLKVYTDYNPEEIVQLNLYYRTGSSGMYMMGTFTALSNDYYSYRVPAEFLKENYIEYYILLESTSGEFQSIPENDPHDVPISLRIPDEMRIDDSFFLDESSGIKSDYNIISPQPEQSILMEDLFVALSYFRMKSIDSQSIQVFIDNINMTNRADIRETNLTLVPPEIKSGFHDIKIILTDMDGTVYDPIKWRFFIIGDLNKRINRDAYSGKIWNDYVDNKVDSLNSYTNNTNFNFKFDTDWIDINAKLKKSSLENIYSQSKDRYSVNFDLNKLKINYGDFYPSINNFSLSGNRVRGIGFKFDTKVFQLDLISGELARAIQGKPSSAMLISDYSSEYICTTNGDNPDTDDIEDDYCLEGSDVNKIDISRSDYTFRRDVSAIRLGFGNQSKMNFGINILKVKDDINSVNKNISNASINLPYEMEIFEQFNSDQFIDINENGEYDINIDEIYYDYNEDGIFDDIYKDKNFIAAKGYDINTPISMERIKLENTVSYCSQYENNDINQGCAIEEELKPLIQWVWDIKVSNEDIEDFLSVNYTSSNSYIQNNKTIDKVTFLDDQWDGNKPEDNLTIGADLSMKSKNNNLKFRTSFAMSLLNENIWNPVKSVEDFDTYSDDYKDCEFGTTYSYLIIENDCTDNLDNCVLNQDYYWYECEAYEYTNTLNGPDPLEDTKINLEDKILTSGVPLDAIPDPESFADVFHYNFDAVPTIPFYSLIQNFEQTSSGTCNLGVCNGDNIYVPENSCLEDDDIWVPIDNKDDCENENGVWIETEEEYTFQLSDLMNSPEIAYDMDFALKVLNNQIKFGIKQVGQSFNTLGNPYLQKDMREKYISNRLRLLENRMFLAFKYSIITNGISETSVLDKSNKFDVNISYYPSIELPSFNISLANYSRKSGEKTGGYDDNDTGAFDTRIETETNNYNLSMNHSFDYMYKQNATLTYYYSSKNDLLYETKERGYEDYNNDGLFGEDESDTTYVSPRSRSRNLGINIKTTYNEKWESNFNYSNNSFDYAQKTSSYYDEQKINSLSAAFSYKMNDKIEKIGAGIDYVNGKGSNTYNQFSIRLYSEFLLLNNINLNIRYNYRVKKIKSSDDYFNSLFKINLSYRF